MEFEDLTLQSAQKEYLDFLDDKSTSRNGLYFEKIQNMIRHAKNRLVINIHDLRSYLPHRAISLSSNAIPEIAAFQRALKEFVISTDSSYGKVTENFSIGFDGAVKSQFLNPRLVRSHHLNKLICVEGIITKVSFIHPKMIKSVHYCPNTEKILERRYSDIFSLDTPATISNYPLKDEDGNLLETEFGLSLYKDHQTITMQELPESAPPGQLPRSIEVILEEDLVDCARAGDRVYIYGVYRSVPFKRSGYTSGSFRTVIIVNNIQISREENPQLSSEDVSKIRRISKFSNIFELLSNSIAPSLSGLQFIKKAILCLLLGGVEKTLQNGTRLRGDINILLIGDPSTAKSQLLRYVFHTLPRAISTTGRGSSGVGLTASITTDSDTGERILEAGAMVLADKGVVCIDEFDKMNDIDRTAIHEVMEQGRVTISKAGIHARLNARCSVLAAANPVYGQYDEYKSPMENIGLQDSLLSRFDLIFILLDNVEVESDKRIAEHVIRMHRFRSELESHGEPIKLDSFSSFNSLPQERNCSENIFEDYNELLHGYQILSGDNRIFSPSFFSKYLQVARALKPTLTLAACDLISTEYTRLRTQDITQYNVAKTQPVTARTLESLIRLSTAHAKSRINKNIDSVDVHAAISMINYAYFKELHNKSEVKSKMDLHSISESVEDLDINNNFSSTLKQQDVFNSSQRESTAVDLKQDLDNFKGLIFRTFSEAHTQMINVDDLLSLINSSSHDTVYSRETMLDFLYKMQEINQIMVSDDLVYLI